MKKICFLFLSLTISISLIGCNPNQKEPANTESSKQVEEVKTEDSNKKETKITDGEIYNKINSISKVSNIICIEDTEIGVKNLTMNVEVSKGTAVEELKAFIENVSKIQLDSDSLFLKNEYKNISYNMYIDGESKSVITTYKRQNGKYQLEDTHVFDEKYKKAADTLN